MSIFPWPLQVDSVWCLVSSRTIGFQELLVQMIPSSFPGELATDDAVADPTLAATCSIDALPPEPYPC